MKELKHVGEIDYICINKYIRPQYKIPYPCDRCGKEIIKECKEYYPILVKYTIDDKIEGLI